ncbi:MAG: DUF3784 domain-containing protein [Clostridia bacterium]|nr:DUF3784 domain-containing protein [Clostridia bacterium]
MVGIIILAVLALDCFIISIMQFLNKGFLFNNSYIHASKSEREKMDKKPYNKQSGIVFLLLGITLSADALELFLRTGKLFFVVAGLLIIALVYAIISSV